MRQHLQGEREIKKVCPPNEVGELVLVHALRLLARASRDQIRPPPSASHGQASPPPESIAVALGVHQRRQIPPRDRPWRHDMTTRALIHATLCALPSAVAPMVTLAALIRTWWYTMDSASRDGRIDLLAAFAKLNRMYGYALDYSPASLDLAAQNGHVNVLQWWLYESNVPIGACMHAIDLAMRGNHVHVLEWIRDLAQDPGSGVTITCKGEVVFIGWERELRMNAWHRPRHLTFYYKSSTCVQAAVDAGALDTLKWWYAASLNPTTSSLEPMHQSLDLSRTTPPVMDWWLATRSRAVLDDHSSDHVSLPAKLIELWIAALLANNLGLAQWLLGLPEFPTTCHLGILAPSFNHGSVWEPLRRFASAAVCEGNLAAISLLCTWAPPNEIFPPGSHTKFTSVSSNLSVLKWLLSEQVGLLPTHLISGTFVDQATSHNHLDYLHWVDLHQPGFLSTHTPSQESLAAAVFAGHVDTLNYWHAQTRGFSALASLARTGPALTCGTTRATLPVSLRGLHWLAASTSTRVTITASLLRTATGHGQLAVLDWCLTQHLRLGTTVSDALLVECIEWAITQGQLAVLDWWHAHCPALLRQHAGALLGVAFVANRPECLAWWFAQADLPFDGRGADISASDGRDALQHNHVDVLDLWYQTGDLARRPWLMVTPFKLLRWCGSVRTMEWMVRVLLDLGQVQPGAGRMLVTKQDQRRTIHEATVCALKCMLTGCLEMLRARLGAERGQIVVPDISYMWVQREQRLDCPSYPCKCVQM